MRENDGRKLDHKTLEQVRIRVVRQVERGARPEYLAVSWGLPVQLVFGWMADTGGCLDVLKARTYLHDFYRRDLPEPSDRGTSVCR